MAVGLTRVSTAEQGQSGMGLEAQQARIRAFVATQGWNLVAEYSDIASGKDDRRLGFQAALARCRQLDAVLVAARLDRITRRAHTLSQLLEDGVSIRAADILLSFAQFEREVIGERIRDKFAASRARGMWMGGRVPLGYVVVARKLVVNEDEAPRVRRVFEVFAETGSGIETVARLRAEGATSKAGRPLDKGDIYKLLNNRTYVGEATHKGQVYPGEHQGIVPRELWDRAHAVLQGSPRSRAAQNRQQAPALLKGLLYGADGRALSPTHTRKKGRLYRYYVAQRVMKGDATGDAGIVRRISAAQIEGAVINQVRGLLRQPEIEVGTWLAARREAPDLTELEVRDALHRLDPLWEELFPAEQARIVRALVERVVVGPSGATIRLRVEGLAGLVRDLGVVAPATLEAAA
ncbi:recombinase family protein [Roseomonas sp. CAU 1739]|uniref:recombinase family protein n=1 Tax=Roseomonas sp. CAU 1739 TaxID=3140364 RepID=UPI00325A515D